MVNISDVGQSGISVVGYNNSLVAMTVTRTGCSGIHVTGGDQVSIVMS